jgi:hypothetical protein
MLIIIGNVICEVSVQMSSSMTRPVNEIVVLFNAIRGISWIQFINLGLVLFIINFSIGFMKKLGPRVPAGIL